LSRVRWTDKPNLWARTALWYQIYRETWPHHLLSSQMLKHTSRGAGHTVQPLARRRLKGNNDKGRKGELCLPPRPTSALIAYKQASIDIGRRTNSAHEKTDAIPVHDKCDTMSCSCIGWIRSLACVIALGVQHLNHHAPTSVITSEAATAAPTAKRFSGSLPSSRQLGVKSGHLASRLKIQSRGFLKRKPPTTMIRV
jgi:hypothetical protein